MITYSIMCTTEIKLAFGFYFSFSRKDSLG